MSTSEDRINPTPQGKYVAATRFGNIIYTAGMTPRKNGVLIQSGKVCSTEPIARYKEAVIQAVTNAYTAAINMLTEEEEVKQVLSLTVYVNADEPFHAHSSIADIASEYLFETLGTAGIGSRAAIGVATLPGNAPIEIQLIVGVTE
ncbi:MAG TPA: RidA family protein [Virgibacillus sp.]|nr:RidA family protein [Virgibacillus sp.]HLR68370.1 RidA family protein [Virgibacillus sp.]